jgi:putative (di)nucleoside polyphosphate hydrolase
MNEKPFRMNVGIALFNARGEVLIAHRRHDDGPEIIVPGHDWQMPQGGIDPHEEPLPAAIRELYEETGARSVDYLGETGWFDYDWPAGFTDETHRLMRWRGQRQKWFAMRFTGDDGEIDVVTRRIDDDPEFDAWRWEKLDIVPTLIVPFKRKIYDAVAREFAKFASVSLSS